MIGRFFRGLTKLVILLTVIILLGLLWMAFGEPNMLSATRVSVGSLYLPEAADGLRIVHFSDTHFGFSYSPDNFNKAVKEINDYEPHIVVFTGDLFEEYAKYESDDAAIIAALSEIRASQGKYAVLGNHDHGQNGKEYSIRVLEAGGFTVLFNAQAELPLLGITITGIDDLMFGQGKGFSLDSLSADTYNLVLCHEPDIFADMFGTNVDLLLSGHTHGGQVRMPVLGELILPPYGEIYPYGHYYARNVRGSQLYVTRGLGTSKLPLRLLAQPEVALITLERKTGETAVSPWEYPR